MIFWVVAGGLCALAVGLLVLPLLRRPRAGAPRAAYDLNVYKDQLAEIAREAERGELGAAQAEAARAEIERRLLATAETGAETGAEEPGGPESPPAIDRAVTWSLAVALGFAVPLTAIGIYLLLGNPGLPSLPFAARPVLEAPAGSGAGGDMAALIAGLVARLAEEPDDRDGWLLLGHSYAQLEQFGAAAEAYRRSIALGFDDAQVQSALGEILTAQADGTIGPEARNAFAAALVHDPQNPRARYYAGLALAQDGRAQAAIDIWLGLLRQSTAEAPWRPVVAQQIQEAAASLGIAAPELPVAPDPVNPDPVGPDAADVEAAGQMSAEDRAAFIGSMVARLAERLEREPGDFPGWLRLARAYGVLGEAAQARDALSRAEAAIRELPEDAPERAQLEAARKELPPGP
ncbi:MAG: c-type cytochrome biogenesis protein CcmI [Proteobacteria bacterium]|nr:c-type cytochrome biogenesis protein CcmI [Pseudomonadota bacterium]